jgi:putative nucleotidyltransferase with HDIG domain
MTQSRFKQTHVDDLKLGMFVASLDRPWIETPFLIQGFTINDLDEIATFRELCMHVNVDMGLSRVVEDVALKASHGGRKRAKVVSKIFPNQTLVTYEDLFSFEDELGSAKKVFDDYEAAVGTLYKSIHTSGAIDMASVSKTVNIVVKSIMRNPDACTLLSAIRNKDNYSYRHAMASSILAAAVGRQIGLQMHDIKALTTATLLCDVGKLKISDRILNKSTPLSVDERRVIDGHVTLSLEILQNSVGVSEQVMEIVRHHHERHNGGGYPDGLSGSEIPPLARIAGLVDTYDAMISDRAYAKGVAPAEAIADLYIQRDVDFQPELVEEFIQTVGVYPSGSLIELTDGRVGMVVTEYRRRRLRPRILVILDSEKNQLQEPHYVNLLDETEDAMGRPLNIHRGVDPSQYDFDADDLFF